MVFQKTFEFEIKDFTTESGKTLDEVMASNTANEEYLYSPLFDASPGEIVHKWRIELELSPNLLGIYLHLEDENFEKPICVDWKFKAFDNSDNEISSQKSQNDEFGVPSKNWGFPEFIDTKKHHLNTVKKINLQLSLSYFKLPSSNFDMMLQVPEDLFKLYESGESYSDLTILCEGNCFKVHKFVIASRSPVFKAMLSKNANEMTIEAEYSDILDRIIKFLYTGLICITSKNVEKLLNMARKYELKGIEDLCIMEMEIWLRTSNAAKYLSLACEFQLSSTKKKIIRFIKENLMEVRKTKDFLDLPREILLEIFNSLT